MNVCEHCEGQRFDRAQVLCALRQLRKALRGKHGGQNADEALGLPLKTVAGLDIPHLELREGEKGEVVH